MPPAAGAAFEIRELVPGETVALGDVKLMVIAVDHGSVRPAYGYPPDRAGHSVAFSGADTRASAGLVAAARGVDVLVHEVVSATAERRLAVYSHIVPTPAGSNDLAGPTRAATSRT